MKSIYDEIYIIGYGRLAKQILTYVSGRAEEYDYKVFFLEYEKDEFSFIQRKAEQLGAGFYSFENKNSLTDHFMGINKEALILSVINNYIFPAAFIKKPNIKILNYHFSLLPKYAGRNGLIWSIYNGEKESGITWHFVEEAVDSGEIVIQKSCMLEKYETAYEVANAYMDLAFEAFMECFDDLVRGTVQGYKNERGKYKEYMLKDIPQDGRFNIDDPPESIYRLLRATDMGGLRESIRITTELDGQTVEIIRYKKIPNDKKKDKENTIFLPFGSGEWLQLKYKIL